MASPRAPLVLACLAGLFEQAQDGVDEAEALLALADILASFASQDELEIDEKNITFNYQLPVGDYEVVINLYNGGYSNTSDEVNYALVAAVNNDEPKVIEGTFKRSASNSGRMSGRIDLTAVEEQGIDVRTNGSHIVYKFTVDETFNSHLPAKVSLTDHEGLWKVMTENDEGESVVLRYIIIEESSVTSKTRCNSYSPDKQWLTEYLPAGFRVNNGTLQVSDAFINAYNSYDSNGGNSFSYVYRDLIQLSEDELAVCGAY